MLNTLRMDGQSSTNFFNPFFFILAGNDDMHESSKEFEIRLIGPPTAELAALERLIGL